MTSPSIRRRKPPARTAEPTVRRGTIRVSPEVSARVRAGHPYVFREALGARAPREAVGEVLEVTDPAGGFVGRGLYDPEGIVAIRIVSRDPGEAWGPTAIERRVRAARELRTRTLGSGLGTAMRVFHSEGDGLPGLAVDRYADHLVVQLFSPALVPLRQAIYDVLEREYRPKSIYEQRRFKPLSGDGPREPASLERGSAAPLEVEIEEYGHKFYVDPTAPAGTGLFLDLREGRRTVARHAAGRRVLNLFSYTGAFSLYAARAGATKIASVDLAAKAHARLRRNLTANGLAEAGHDFIVGDAFKVLAQKSERREQFDLIVIDPPSFAQAKGRAFSVLKDYRELVEAALAVAAPGALVACVSNALRLPYEEFDRAIGEGAGRARRNLRVIERHGLPPDFPVPAGYAEGHYLKFALCAAD